jgi:hypothetical protein
MKLIDRVPQFTPKMRILEVVLLILVLLMVTSPPSDKPVLVLSLILV